MMDGITHAIATCDRIERGLTDAAGHENTPWPRCRSNCRTCSTRSTPTAQRFPNERATIQTSVVDHAIILAALVAAFAFSANGHSSGSTHPGVVQLPR